MSELTDLSQLRDKFLSDLQEYCVMLLDAKGYVLSWNIGAERLRDYTKTEVIGQHFSIFYLPADRDSGLPELLLSQARKEGRANHVGRRLTKSGNVTWEHVHITSLQEEGKTLGYAVVTREISHGSNQSL